MNRDSKLIFEAYNNKQQVVLEGNTGDFMYFLAQVIDPTGLLSVPDLLKAIERYNNDGSILNLSLLILAIFCCIPNLGLLAAGVGGVPWAGARAAARAAIKAGPHAVIPASDKLLKVGLSLPGGRRAAERLLRKLLESNKITQQTFDDVLSVFNKGQIDNYQHGLNVAAGTAGVSGVTNAAKGGITLKQAGVQGGAKAATGIAQDELGVDSVLGDEGSLDDESEERPSKSATGRKGQRF